MRQGAAGIEGRPTGIHATSMAARAHREGGKVRVSGKHTRPVRLRSLHPQIGQPWSRRKPFRYGRGGMRRGRSFHKEEQQRKHPRLADQWMDETATASGQPQHATPGAGSVKTTRSPRWEVAYAVHVF